MKFNTVEELKKTCEGILTISDGKVEIVDTEALRGAFLDRLVYNAVFGSSGEVRGWARWLIKKAAWAYGTRPASIQNLYDRIGSGDLHGFTVPAINIRGITYDFARALTRSAKRINAGAFIFEIAKSEQGYTNQTPSEYVVVVLAAALKEGYRGPVFIQGDHYQINAKKFAVNREQEVEGLKKLIRDSIAAGFYNIDIDSSTIVDLDKPTIPEQQRLNSEIAADMTALIRSIEPKGVTVSVGGEIGEVGGKNSSPEEFRAYMDIYLSELKKQGDYRGISKISVQTGTSHGGIPTADGKVAKVKLDFNVLKEITDIAQSQYGISGSVQHGASTLPADAFHRFPEYKASEVHLATEFQNIIYNSPHFPADFREEIYTSLRERFGSEKKDGDTDEQFIYKTRKKGFGNSFKEKFWNLPESVRSAIGKELEEKFDFLFNQLNIADTHETVVSTVGVPENLEFDLEKEIGMSG